jgi:hypothetical protein
MSKFPIDTGIAGKAMAATGIVGTPNGIPAWPFENQTGTYGNLLNGSVVWYNALTETGAQIRVIPAGTSKASLEVKTNADFTILTAGSGYTGNTELNTTDSNPRSGTLVKVKLTVDGSGVVTAVEVTDGGSGLQVGDILTVDEAGRAVGSTDCTLKITKVQRGIPTVDEAVEFKVQGCGVLPIAIDYIAALNNITATELVICK